LPHFFAFSSYWIPMVIFLPDSMTKEMISILPLWTFFICSSIQAGPAYRVYILHWDVISKFVLPFNISLIESCCQQRSYWICGKIQQYIYLLRRAYSHSNLIMGVRVFRSFLTFDLYYHRCFFLHLDCYCFIGLRFSVFDVILYVVLLPLILRPLHNIDNTSRTYRCDMQVKKTTMNETRWMTYFTS